MTPLVFELRVAYGQRRYYAACPKSDAVLKLADRKCLTQGEIEALRSSGLELLIHGAETTDKSNGGVS